MPVNIPTRTPKLSSSRSCTANSSGVAVQDTGPGIPAGKAENMFEKFTRGERESATVGVGLGLAICKAIVEAHGGKIRADESYRDGASIEFTLPLGDPPKISLPEHDEPLANYPSHD